MAESETLTGMKRQLFSIQLMLAGIGLILFDYARVGIVDVPGGLGAVALLAGVLWGAVLTFAR